MNESKDEMDLMQAIQIIANAGLTVVSSNGTVKAKPKKQFKNRRPKGTGSVYKLSGKRSKPYVASYTLGYNDETGKQIQKPIGYFKTREEALYALEEHNMKRTGVIVQTSNDKKINKCPTVKEIWDIIFEEDIANKKSYRTISSYKVGFKNIKDIHHMKVNELDLHVLQPMFNKTMEKGAGISKLNIMKVVCKAIFEYALKYDYVEKDYTEFIKYESTNKPIRKRKVFTNEEIKKMFDDGSFESKIVLISIFTGMRPQELVNIKKENVFLKDDYMIGGMKTKSGKDRIIPIHNLIKPFITELMEDEKRKYLIFDFDGIKGYKEYRINIFNALMNKLNIINEPYATRHTFATLGKLSNMNEFARKKIMGHSCNDLTDDVYTHAPIEFLVNEINKIKID